MLDLQCQLSTSPTLGQSATQPGVGRGGVGSVHRVPLCCDPLGVERQPPPPHSFTHPPQRSTSFWAPINPPPPPPLCGATRSSSFKDWPITALRHARHLQPGSGEQRAGGRSVAPALSPISQFFDTKITLAGTCNSHISGWYLFFLASVLFVLFFFLNVLFCFFVYMQWSTNLPGCWISPSLFICRNTLVRGASVCSSCVLNAKRGSILQSVIDCLFLCLNWSWSCSCVLTVFCTTSR